MPIGNTATGYLGTLHFTSTDAQASLPANYTFVAGDAGTHAFSNSVTLKTAGNQSVTATDTVTTAITGSQGGILVTAGVATQLSVTGISGGTAGSVSSATVKALDPYGNTATGYTGTVRFSSTDVQALLPTDYTFVAADNGIHLFSSAVTLKTAGTQSVTATDTVTSSVTGVQTGIGVTVGAVSRLLVNGGVTATLGQAMTLTVTAADAYNNVNASYTGTVHFTSTDATAVLPSSYTFASGDAGTHAFNVVLNTTGTWAVTAGDTVIGSINGSQTGIVVTPPSLHPAASSSTVRTHAACAPCWARRSSVGARTAAARSGMETP